jgi:hypothetical protein
MSFPYAPNQRNARGNEYSLLSLDAGILDHRAPELLLAVEISVELGRLNTSDCTALAADLLRRSMISGGVFAGANRPYPLSTV